MMRSQVKNYLNQVAFSSAEEFITKYQTDSNIIGHFGLGFYSAFMVADKVEVSTRSGLDAKAHKWVSDGKNGYELEETTKEGRGTSDVVGSVDELPEYLFMYLP